ncbi:MAG: hypothetical protein ABEI78_01005 [Candidatus Nanohaloarchaea archaeon]
MSLLYFVGGLALGFIFGIGASLFYLRWKMQKQIGNVQEQMDAVMDLSEEMDDMMSGIDEEGEVIEEAENKDQEDKES